MTRKQTAIAKIVAAKLGGKEIHVKDIANKWGNVGSKELTGDHCFALVYVGHVSQPVHEKICKQLQIPFAPYRRSWKRMHRGSGPRKFSPVLEGVVVRLDHAPKLEKHLKLIHVQQKLKL